jgi:uncharacterized protein
MGDDTALERPARATISVAARLADWLLQGCEEIRIPQVKIAFHGGEPMLLHTSVFDEMCDLLRHRISGVADVSFSIQTNGTIFNDAWLKAFRRHAVTVGVSIDGDREAHDRYRLDRHGRSTFDKTEATIRSLVESAGSNPALLPSTISVLDHRVDYGAQYNYLRRLGIQSMSYLLPDRNADDDEFRSSGMATEYGSRMLEIFQAWLSEDNPEIQVRFIDEALRHFRVGVMPGPSRRARKDNQILIVRSDGTVSVDDSYIPALEWYTKTPIYSIFSTTVRDVLSDPIFLAIEAESASLPAQCSSCTWRRICGGGDLENRYSRVSGFDNPSIYSDAYKVLYAGMCRMLVEKGYPTEQISLKFDGTVNV